ncbi:MULTISPECIES: GH92 family glycosyl hydrolase [unclassified Stenotrophomonas]|uniref:GH92 family glycosyl hydrolase n=1 Tax=unclassified Stenotrophomonas TaxID=196198 RepID=UPI0017806A13|nr:MULTISPECIES: GH92 family glycosyl hydrolase [unclassified Stenotrophomonas]MBD8636168.1 GH92 family glycosyl hydrolase [Stenotrophomonas sp. CFBP 13725]MBD8695507.1 GH92 family glycosyl hydrolase [Stenotrophomonas sp. CFBP 13718]
MPLSVPHRARRAPLFVALALVLVPVAHAAPLLTSFEPGQPSLVSGQAGPLQLRVGAGPRDPYAAKAGMGYTGLHAVHYASPGGAARQVLLQTDQVIEADTTLSWLVLPEIVDGDTVSSTYASLDLLLDDGQRVSASAARDQHGVALGARAQGDSRTLYPQQWARKAVRLGDVPGLQGRRVVAVELEVASAAGAPVSGWIDDVQLAPQPMRAPQRPSDWVLTTRGTQSNGRFSRGNNIPATAVPHGFNFWTPATDAGVINWLYRWNEHNDTDNRPRLQALSLSHQPSPWMGDRQTFQVMPSASRGVPEADRRKRALAFSHDQETARPHRYDVRFDNGIGASIAPTDHAALFRFEFPAEGDANLLFDNVDARGGLTLDAATQTLTGYTDVRSGLSNGATRMYVVASFDRPWRSSGAIETGRPTGYIKFDPGSERRVHMRIATSLISVEQARHNLALELASDDDIERVAGRAQDLWDARLGAFDIGDASADQKTTLYSNLYRLYLYPNSGHENVGSAQSPEWRYASQASAAEDNTDGSAVRSFAPIRDGRVYVNNGFWDTFRTTWPAYALFRADDAGNLVQGFLEQYAAGGWVARWSSPGYADLMVGTSSDVAFADAWLKGVRGFDVDQAYNAALKNATVVPPDRHVGRKGMDRSTFRGFASSDVHEGMSWTMEGALNDFGIANMASALATSASTPAQRERLATEADYFRHRAAGYATMFDATAGFFQGRREDGSWRVPSKDYDARVWGHDYTESNGWTFAFTAAHDGEGLAALYGGREALAAKLDAFFATPETADPALVGSYGGVIHEMTEARDVRMGMYAHSNQPSHHIPWMYLYTGQPWKTQKHVREILARLYVGSEIGQGYPGDEDNGETSAWYLFASLGLYPLRMGAPEYAIGSPLFRHAKVTLQDGAVLTVNAADNSPENVYVQSLKVNGKPWTKTWLPHDVIAAGATLDFQMGPQPSRWGTGAGDALPSLTPRGARPALLHDLLARGAKAALEDGRALDALLDDDAGTAVPLGAKASVVFTGAATGVPSMYTLTSGDGAIRGGEWTLEARTTNGRWTTLDARKAEDFAWARQTRPFRIAKPGHYAEYRLRINAPGRLQLAEVELLAPGATP